MPPNPHLCPSFMLFVSFYVSPFYIKPTPHVPQSVKSSPIPSYKSLQALHHYHHTLPYHRQPRHLLRSHIACAGHNYTLSSAFSHQASYLINLVHSLLASPPRRHLVKPRANSHHVHPLSPIVTHQANHLVNPDMGYLPSRLHSHLHSHLA